MPHSVVPAPLKWRVSALLKYDGGGFGGCCCSKKYVETLFAKCDVVYYALSE